MGGQHRYFNRFEKLFQLVLAEKQCILLILPYLRVLGGDHHGSTFKSELPIQLETPVIDATGIVITGVHISLDRKFTLKSRSVSWVYNIVR